MLAQVPRPIRYAERLLAAFGTLAQVSEQGRLTEAFARQACELTGCELAQVYLLDLGHTALELSAECLDGSMQAREAAAMAVDYHGDQLLQFCLCQDRVLYLDALADGIHSTSFLPAFDSDWRSLLCVPLSTAAGRVSGLLVCASPRSLALRPFADSLAQLGRFVLGQMGLLLHAQGAATMRAVPKQIESRANDHGLIGNSEAMRRACRLIDKVLHTTYTVLLKGETGTGKEVVARALHECGPRRSKKFVVQNCAAFPEDLLESELFGHRKGAFTGADRDRQGLFQAAHGGTLLLDEIGDMPLRLQAKLLRVLQDGQVRPLGSNDTLEVDVRIIAATHRDLPSMIAQGSFREDLYYRLAQFPIVLPPLRDRGDDVQLLASHFATQACARLERPPLRWSEMALAHLSGHVFPGNVRELKGMVERAVLMCEGDELQVEHFGTQAETGEERPCLPLRDYLQRAERAYTLACLRGNKGNQTATARQLGLPRRTFLYRLGRLNVDLSEFKA